MFLVFPEWLFNNRVGTLRHWRLNSRPGWNRSNWICQSGWCRRREVGLFGLVQVFVRLVLSNRLRHRRQSLTVDPGGRGLGHASPRSPGHGERLSGVPFKGGQLHLDPLLGRVGGCHTSGHGTAINVTGSRCRIKLLRDEVILERALGWCTSRPIEAGVFALGDSPVARCDGDGPGSFLR